MQKILRSAQNDKKSIQNAYGVVTNKQGEHCDMQKVRLVSRHIGYHNVIGFVGDNTNKGGNAIGFDRALPL